MAEREDNLVTRAMLDELTAKESAVVLLVDIQGHSIAEAATLLRVTKGTAQHNRSRAHLKLRARLREEEHRTL